MKFEVENGVLRYCIPDGFVKTLRLPDGIKSIGERALKTVRCGTLIVPEGCTTLEARALQDCLAYQIVLPATLRSIGERAFEGCCPLPEISIPEGTAELYPLAFENCLTLSAIHLPASLQTIHGSLGSLPKLKKLDLAEGNPYFWSDGISLYSQDRKTLYRVTPKCPSTYEIPDGVTEIVGDAFADCENLESIHIPDSVAAIGERVFAFCSNLRSLHFPDGIRCIPKGTCFHCYGLKDVSLPSSLVELGDSAFDGVSFEEVVLPEGFTTLGCHVFDEVCPSTLVIPSTCTEVDPEPLSYSMLDRLVYRPKFLDALQAVGCVNDPLSLDPGEIEEVVLESVPISAYTAIPEALMAPVCRAFVRRHEEEGKPLTKKEMAAVAQLSHLAKWDCWADEEIGPFLIQHKLIRLEDYAEAAWGIEHYFDTIETNRQSLHLNEFLDLFDHLSEEKRQKIKEIQEALEDLQMVPESSDDFTADEADHFFDWFEQDDGTIMITDYHGIATEVIIPETIDGVPITAIGPWAFSPKDATVPKWQRAARRRITSVVCPYSICRIEDRAFCGCENLQYVSFVTDDYHEYPKQYFGIEAFRDCTSLAEIIFPEGIMAIHEGCFQNCTALTEVTVPSSIRQIPGRAFKDCADLKELILKEGVSLVDNAAFDGCKSLTRIQLPKSLKLLTWMPFADCPIQTVTAPRQSKAWTLAADEDGITLETPSARRNSK